VRLRRHNAGAGRSDESRRHSASWASTQHAPRQRARPARPASALSSPTSSAASATSLSVTAAVLCRYLRWHRCDSAALTSASGRPRLARASCTGSGGWGSGAAAGWRRAGRVGRCRGPAASQGSEQLPLRARPAPTRRPSSQATSQQPQPGGAATCPP
jgi:hypothetical protein